MGSVIDLKLPRLGETMETGRIVAWLKNPGEAVKRGETVLEVETDKTVVEVPALEDFILDETLVGPDDTVDVDQPIARIRVERDVAEAPARPETVPVEAPNSPPGAVGEAGVARTDSSESPSNGKVRASPLARRLARHHGIDLTTLTGSGRRGRITGDDVRARIGHNVAVGPAPHIAGPLAIQRYPGRDAAKAPVILFHGLFADGSTWSDIARRIAARGRTAFTIDLPGHGASPASNGDIAAMTDAAAAAVETAADGPVRLAGHSLGAVVATSLAGRLPNVDSLLLVAPAGVGRAIDQGFLDAMLAVTTPDALLRELAAIGIDPATLSRQWTAGQIERLLANADGLRRLVDALAQDGVQQVYIGRELAALRIPVRAIFGLADPVVPWQQVSELPANVGVHFVREGGHMPHWSAADLVTDLLDGRPPG